MAPDPRDSPAATAADGLADGGAPLEPGIRDQLSSSFGHDFSPVRVHVGKQADRAARGLGALAYTVGNDVVFRDGAYDPLSDSGRALIAHEVAHVAQHGGRAYAANFLRADPTSDLPAADARLEHQADEAARHRNGLPRSWAWERATRPFLGRVGEGWSAPPAPYKVRYAGQDRTIDREQWSPDEPTVARVMLGDFVVPQSKGPWADHYDRVAREGGLQAVIDVSRTHPRSELKDRRAPTPELRNLWLLRVQWPRGTANQWWHDAGGLADSGRDFDPRTQGGRAQIDHIVEMQLGGTNVPENLAPHDAAANRDSGTTIWRDVREAAVGVREIIRAREGGRRLDNVILHWSSASQPSAYVVGPELPALPSSGQEQVLEQRRGRAATAARVHLTAMADLAAGTRPGPAERQARAAAQAAMRDYPLKAGPNSATIKVGQDDRGNDLIENSPVPENQAARELVPGLVLSEVRRVRQAGRHRVIGWLNSDEHPIRSGNRLPLTITNERDKSLEFSVDDPYQVGRLQLRGRGSRVRFTYPYLSRGELRVDMTDQGLVGEGHLRPSVPLLRRARMDVLLGPTGLSGSLRPERNQLRLPPFRITDTALTVTLAPELSAGGFVAFALGNIVTGRIEGGVDTDGLFARGDIQATIPGLDQATGHVEYRPATGPIGHVVASASRATGLVRSGQVRLDFTGDGWTAAGELGLMLPNDSPAQLRVDRQGQRIVYTGRATINVPGLRPVETRLRYDGEHLTGSARTTFSLLGSRGDIELRYRDGRFSGQGAVDLERGRFRGRLEAELHPNGRMTGRGSGSFEIRPGLVGTIGIEYGRDRRLKTTGELRFPPYRFLDARPPVRRELFSRNLPDIPIFALSLGVGSVGIVARIGAALYTTYSFGPGEIRDMVIAVEMYPLEDDLEAQLTAGARLVIPAEMGLELQFRAGLAASVVIADAAGYITVTGGVRLRGGLDATAQLSYARGILTFDARARILAQLALTLAIGYLIEVDAVGFDPWRWPGTLASWTFDTGLQFGLVAPFHYQSDQDLRLPSVSDIEWITPDIDVGQLVDSLAGRVRRALDI